MRKRLLRSRSGFEKPESREEAIMQNILGASNVLEPSESNIEEILKSILYNTPYTKEAEFDIEKILLAIKNNGTYDGEVESRDMKILLAILRDSTYNEEPESRIEELFIEWLQQHQQIKVLEGVPPLTFSARGLPLINYLIEGNTVQSGTPTPDNPVMPEGCGDLETTGEHTGQYKIPISSANTTTPIYLGEVETERKIYKMRLVNPINTTQTPYGYRLVFSISSHSAAPYQSGGGICNITTWNPDYNKVGFVATNQSVFITQNIPEWATVEGATAWLNEHEVYIWYVLATPETAVVNEPLMKIGDYADSISKEQAGVQIPTNNGTTVIDVDTTVKPSNIYIEYK